MIKADMNSRKIASIDIIRRGRRCHAPLIPNPSCSSSSCSMVDTRICDRDKLNNFFVYRGFDNLVGLDRTVVSMVHCGCIDPGSIPGLDNVSTIFAFCSGEIVIF